MLKVILLVLFHSNKCNHYHIQSSIQESSSPFFNTPKRAFHGMIHQLSRSTHNDEWLPVSLERFRREVSHRTCLSLSSSSCDSNPKWLKQTNCKHRPAQKSTNWNCFPIFFNIVQFGHAQLAPDACDSPSQSMSLHSAWGRRVGAHRAQHLTFCWLKACSVMRIEIFSQTQKQGSQEQQNASSARCLQRQLTTRCLHIWNSIRTPKSRYHVLCHFVPKSLPRPAPRSIVLALETATVLAVALKKKDTQNAKNMNDFTQLQRFP